MARYAEWNSFIQNLKTDKYGQTNVNEVGIAFDKATADVAPKSEVERLQEQYRILEAEYDRMENEESKHYDAILKAKAEVAKKKFVVKSRKKSLRRWEATTRQKQRGWKSLTSRWQMNLLLIAMERYWLCAALRALLKNSKRNTRRKSYDPTRISIARSQKSTYQS